MAPDRGGKSTNSGSRTRTPVGSRFDPANTQAICDLVADLLGVMVVVTDMEGRALCDVSNPCGLQLAVGNHPRVERHQIEEHRKLCATSGLTTRLTPSYLGLLCARSFIRIGIELAGMVIAGGMEAKCVIYPIGEGVRDDRPLTNWAVLVKVGEGGAPPNKEDWSRPGRFQDLMPHVQRFRIPYVDAKALIEATPEFWEFPMCDRDPLPRWSHGRVTLLGDAAHPMLPYLAQGAAMAVEDGCILADRLACLPEEPAAALRDYERLRMPRTRRAQLGSRQRAKENHLASPLARLARDVRLALRNRFAKDNTPHQAAWLYDYDVAAVK